MELQKQEETLAPFKRGLLRRAAVACKSTIGVGVDGFHPRVPLDLSDECCGGLLTLLLKLVMSGNNVRN